jgi:transposase
MPNAKDLAFFLPSKKLKFINNTQFRRGFLWELETIPTRSEPCPRCGTICSQFYGKAKTRLRDEPLRSETLYLEITKQRYFCKVCKKPFVEQIDGFKKNQRSTGRFEKFIAEMCENFSNISDVQKRFQCSSSFAYKVFYKYQAIKLKEKINYGWPSVIGIDEHFFTRRNGYTEYVTVLTDMNKKRLYEMVEGKNTKTLIEQLKHLEGRENVKLVAMDMSSTYKKFVRDFFPNAMIVADKFHVLRLLTPTIMKMQKEIHGHRQELLLKKLVLKNRMKMDYFLRSDVDKYLKQHPELDMIYRFKERLYEFYRTKGMVRAVHGFYRFINQLKGTGHKALLKLAKTMERWKKEILLYFETGLTNARTEAFNRTAKLVQRRACGYKSFKNYRLRTLNACS